MTASEHPMSDLSPTEAATAQRIEAAPDAEESLRERVARALFDAANPISKDFPDYWDRVTEGEKVRDHYRRLADAAIAVVATPTAEGGPKRCEGDCGCRYGTNDPDRLDCGCDGPCTMLDDEAWGTPNATTPSGGDGIEEMSETAVLRVRLQWTEADLEHVAAERDGLREAVTSLAVRFETLAEALHSVPAADAYDDAGQSLRAVLAERGQG